MINDEIARPLAGRIAAFFEILQDPMDERREDPHWAPLVNETQQRYRELKRKVSFMDARRLSMEESLLTILRSADLPNEPMLELCKDARRLMWTYGLPSDEIRPLSEAISLAERKLAGEITSA
jgi:hypothetical protein